MTEYVILITGDADRWWTSMTEDERRAGYAEYDRFGTELERRGHTVTGGAELKGMATARWIAPYATAESAGPYAETTEQVGGFYTVQTNDLDDLMECCLILTALGEGVQVRPVNTDDDRPS